MRSVITLVALLLCGFTLYAQVPAKVEAHLKNITQALQMHSPDRFRQLFPSVEDLEKINPGYEPDQRKKDKAYYDKMANEFDAQVQEMYTDVIKEEQRGFSWKHMQYKEAKLDDPRSENMHDHTIKEYSGYALFRDNETGKNYVASVSDMIEADGKIWGIKLRNVQEAQSIDEFLSRSPEETLVDTAATATMTDTAVNMGIVDSSVAVAIAAQEVKIYKGTVGTEQAELQWIDDLTVTTCMYITPKSKRRALLYSTGRTGDDGYMLTEKNNEDVVTGTWTLHKNGKTLTGVWISPDGNKQKKINLAH